MKKPPINPVNNMGTISKCAICKSVMHWAPQCSHYNSTLLTGTEQQIVQQNPPYSSDLYAQPAEQDELSPVFELECDIEFSTKQTMIHRCKYLVSWLNH